MIVKITQTASNIKQLFDIKGEGFYFQGKCGGICRLKSITLSDKLQGK